jgi:multidrug efflux pump subunit AcrB
VAPAAARGDFGAIQTQLIDPPATPLSQDRVPGIPLSALGRPELVPEVETISRVDGERVNQVFGYLIPYRLPAPALAEFRERLTDSGFALPAGYRISFGGEEEERSSAVGGLLALALPLLVVMIAAVVLSFNSFAYGGIIGLVGFLSVGLAMFGVWLFGYPLGFTAIVGAIGLVGLSINGSIVVLSALRADAGAQAADLEATVRTVMGASRHIVSTTLTTIGGFTPLILFGGTFWPPLATAIAGGVGGSAIIALFSVPAAFHWMRRRAARHVAGPAEDAARAGAG